MRRNKTVTTLVVMALVIQVILAGCSTTSPEPVKEPVTIKMAVLPILERLPMYIADQEGLFEKYGVKVEFIEVNSAPERDAVITSGQADGMINEVVSTIFYNKDKTQIQIVRYSRTATSNTPLFRILASKSSGIESPNDLKGVDIGISHGTVIEYLTDRLLEAEGFSNDEIKTIAVPKIPDRLALLASGELKAGMLPDPLSSMAVLQGSKVVLDDSSHPDFSFSTLSFRKDFIDENPDAIKGFLQAIEEAIQMINSDPAKWKSLLIEKKMVPEPLLGDFEIPMYVTAGVPTQEQWNDVMDWVISEGLVKKSVSYTDSVVDKFLPGN